MCERRQGEWGSWRCACATSREAGKVPERRSAGGVGVALRERFLQRQKRVGRGIGHGWQSPEKVRERKK